VLSGALVGVGLTAVVAVLTFVAHQHLPYRRMLVLTGVMLGFVLIVMVGESAQELQQAHRIGATDVGLDVPEWAGLWFAIQPTVESLLAQVAGAALVLGSYVGAQYVRVRRPRYRSA
jgi:high-affinity iron transporter